jgi:catechol 2,3-dioxygenase-like lactoylglutathione lyase family enzyme
MRNGITGIDHTLVGVRDLETARILWERLGFATSARGKHMGWGTANYCIMFPDDYIELLGIVDPAQFTNNLDKFLETREGLVGLAFATESGDQTAAALAARGLHPAAPRDLARQLELPEGTVLPRFKLVFLPPEETPALSSFVCQHLTPEFLRRPEWLDHPNGAIGLAGATVIVDDPAALVGRYERLFGPARVNTTDDIVSVHAGRHRLVFCTADDFAAMNPELDLPDGTPPFMAMMSIRVRDLQQTADCLASWQVDHEEPAGDRVLVPASEASGAILEFVEDR